MAKRISTYDQIADELSQWIEETADSIASEMIGAGPAPFSAKTTEAEALAYYDRQFFNPDGTPNVQGRELEMARVGAQGFADAMREVMKMRGVSAGLPEPDMGIAVDTSVGNGY